MPQQQLSAAGRQLFGATQLGDLLADEVSTETEELRKRRMAQLAGRPVSAGFGADLGMALGPLAHGGGHAY